MTRRLLPFSVAAFLLTWLLPIAALAGGPLEVCQPGVPFVWPGGGNNIPFNPDQGDLGRLTNAQAIAATQDAFNVWAAVSTSTVTYVNAGTLAVDVTIENFLPFLFPAAPDGLSAIVFDDTGEIFELLFGEDSGVLGFAGPEWLDPASCTIVEGVSFLNGPSFDDLIAAKDVMVHEFGHYTNLAHTVVNGQNLAFDDTTGPTPFNTFGDSPLTEIETMYPFYFGPGSGTQTLERDDVAMVSTIYPAAGSFASTATITGRILVSNGAKRTGVNVIARNIADPFNDAVSAISSDFTRDYSQANAFTGVYTLHGLTPNAPYVVFVDQILAGGFSTPPAFLPGPEEFWNGAAESDDVTSEDNPSDFVAIQVAAGVTRTGVDIIFNAFRPGDPLPVGDDGFVQIFLPFEFKVCGATFDSVFINANGSLTFGAGSGDFSETSPEFLAGPPRIAGLWDDLNNAASGGGTVTFDQDHSSFTAHWDAVPEFPRVGSNTFAITLKGSANHASIEYGDLTAVDGLAGLSCGGAVASGFELETKLRTVPHRRTINVHGRTAVFEQFTTGDNDLDGYELQFVNFKRGFSDVFESNNTIADATRIHLPLGTADADRFSAIDPVGDDVDYYRFRMLVDIDQAVAVSVPRPRLQR
jgi:hypothetical protein